MEALQLNLITQYRADLLSPYGAEMPSTDFYSFSIEYLARYRSKKSSYGAYRNAVNHFDEYQRSLNIRHQTNEIGCDVLEEFLIYLQEVKELRLSTSNGIVRKIKYMLKKASIKKWAVDDSYTDMCQPRDRTVKQTLYEDEVEQLFYFTELTKQEEKIRDMFVLQCHTSLRYSDLKRLTYEHIVDGVIEMVAQKTKEELRIAVSTDRYIQRIFDKYNNKLPEFRSIQHYNYALKRIFKKAGLTRRVVYEEVVKGMIVKVDTSIDQLVASHMARRTFVTLKIADGWSLDAIAACTGHKSLNTLMLYDWNDKRKKVLKAAS